MTKGARVLWGLVGTSALLWSGLGRNARGSEEQGGDALIAQGKISPAPPSPPRVVVLPLRVAAVDTAPDTGASPIAGAAVDVRVLVITAKGDSAGFDAIAHTLRYLGTPFDVLNASTGPALTADQLASGPHGKYNAIFLDVGDLSIGGVSAFSDDEWGALTAYELAFGVRRVALYTAPNASYGLDGNEDGVDPAKAPIAASCTAAGAAVFVGANCDNPVRIDDGTAYPTTARDAATIPLLVDASGNVYAAIRTYPDGREALALTFGQSSSYVSYLELAYGLVSWASHGLFVGERHVYAMPQLDDLFLSSAIYTGGVYRITDADMQAFADWQTATQANPITAGFRVAWAANGSGSAARPGDPLTAKAVALGPTFAWINHSWDHPVLDALGYADVVTEFTRNDAYLRGLGLTPYASINAVTPNVSGLGSVEAMRAIHDVGIRQIVSDSSYPAEKSPSPNAGIWNALQPTVLELPRMPSNLYFNVSQPAEWITEFQALHARSLDYPTLIASQSDPPYTAMLNGDNSPWMFHQANTRDYDGAGHSLLSDLLDATFARYEAVMTFPVVSPTMDDLAGRVMDRMALDASGVVATVQGGTLTVTVGKAATVPVTGLCAPGAESYGGQTITYLTLADGQSASTPLGNCPPGGGASGGPGDQSTAGHTVGVTTIGDPAGGCACALGERSPGAPALCWTLLLGLGFVARRRRRPPPFDRWAFPSKD
jgi:peptidoglycan/xylan/chitin deacetylase (PgdA/CDA1 family)